METAALVWLASSEFLSTIQGNNMSPGPFDKVETELLVEAAAQQVASEANGLAGARQVVAETVKLLPRLGVQSPLTLVGLVPGAGWLEFGPSLPNWTHVQSTPPTV